MASAQALVGCLAFVLGLWAAVVPWGGWILLGVGLLASIWLPRLWRSPLPRLTWLIAGAIALFASVYLPLRTPQPAPHDVSRLLSPNDRSLKVLVTGKVLSLPRLTRSEKSQFWLQAQAIAPIGDGKPVTGKIYTTVPPDTATALHPGQLIQVSGSLYLPQPAANPGGFDFQAYLRQEGSFAGLRGDQVTLKQDSQGWGWWQLQQRIVAAQQHSLGSPAGALVTAMVLGGRAVDLPFAVKDAFVHVGLAHALAASGFQTSLILGVVLTLTRRLPPRLQFVAGSLALGSFVGLAGGQPAVLRAALMGFGGLVAVLLNRQVKPLGALLLTGVILLVVYPLWIFDLGFQLSFLATLGLLVTAPPLTQRLDWLPSAIASMVAVPIAAYLWTLPLQLYAFGVLSPYSIPINILTTLPISVISLGGMASALVAIAWSPGGSALAWLLKFPTEALLWIVDRGNQLPGNSFAIGTISLALVLVLYGLLGLANGHRWWQQRWYLPLGLGMVLILVPVGMGATSTQATILATSQNAVLVLRDRGRVLVMSSGDDRMMQATVLPYLQSTGVNQIDWAIATTAQAATEWAATAQRFAVKYVLQPPILQASPQATGATAAGVKPIAWGVQQTATVGATQITRLSANPAIAQFTLGQQTWLWLDRLNTAEQQALLTTQSLPHVDVLWWTGKSLQPELITQIRPTVAIASSPAIATDTEEACQQHQIPLFVTGRDGAIQWTPAQGFAPYANTHRD